MVATYHLTREADITVAVALAGIAARLHDDADDPCIDGVYWWHEATLHTLDIAEDGTVEIPPQLAEAVARLP